MHLLSAFQVLEVHFVVGRVRESRLAHNSVYAVELFSSLRGVVSVAQNHTIIYLQQLYRLFITGSLLTQKGEARATRSLSAALVLSLSLSLRERSWHAQAYECPRRTLFPLFSTAAHLPSNCILRSVSDIQR